MIYRGIYFWCSLVLYISFIGFLDALKRGDDGVCVVKISTRKTRSKIVTTGKMCGKKRCTTRKVEYYTVPEERIVCCNGWEYDVSADSCAAVCSTGCVGGRCVAPETCHCDPPAILHPDHKNTCLLPTCEPPCVNAQCTNNNNCTCLPDHTRYNSTHCLHCDPGHSIQNFTCTPICEECTNGRCTEPNKCTCLEGYETIDGKCEPKCADCVNSTCVAPDTCSCFDGFTKVNNTTCVPYCADCDEVCVAPNVCSCRSGYKNETGVCKPVCDGCDNGTCVAPGECSCNEGFAKNGTTCISCSYPIEVVTT